MYRVAFNTLGCKVNQYETDAVRKMFENAGYEVVPFGQIADVYVVNTCTVTALSDRKSRQMLRRAINKNNEAVIVAMGCYSQTAPEDIEKIEGVDLIIGTSDRKEIINLVENKLLEKSGTKVLPTVHVNDIMKQRVFEEIDIDNTQEHTRAYMKIQDGCTQFCSYCKIPYSRGPIRSRNIDDIREEAMRLNRAGFKEVVFTGIHLASYGKDLKNENLNLVSAIECVHQVEGIERIRLGSIEPSTVTEEFVAAIIKYDKLCPHFHISLQSGSNNTLREMNRKYSKEEFANATRLLREAIPNVAITTDIIVGFPGETEEHFEESYAFVESQKFAGTHVFKFSRRKGTKAYDMKNQVQDDVKESRSAKMIKLSKINQMKYELNMVGTQNAILIENIEIVDDCKYISGYTENYIMCRVKCDEKYDVAVNDIVDIKVTDVKNGVLEGVLV